MFGRIKRGKNGLFNVMSLPYQLILVSSPCIWCILSKKGVQFHCLTLAIYGTSWVHKKGAYPELGNHPLVLQVVEAGRRILAKPSNRKKALEVSQVKKVISRLGQGNLGEVQVAALFALGFFGFLRWDDLSRLTVDCETG